MAFRCCRSSRVSLRHYEHHGPPDVSLASHKSRATFPILSRDHSFQTIKKPGKQLVIERIMAEKNGESTPRTISSRSNILPPKPSHRAETLQNSQRFGLFCKAVPRAWRLGCLRYRNQDVGTPGAGTAVNFLRAWESVSRVAMAKLESPHVAGP